MCLVTELERGPTFKCFENIHHFQEEDKGTQKQRLKLFISAHCFPTMSGAGLWDLFVVESTAADNIIDCGCTSHNDLQAFLVVNVYLMTIAKVIYPT